MLIVGHQVYAYLLSLPPSPQVHPWDSAGIVANLFATPVLISDDPTWEDDHWALLEDGVVVASGYGNPVQPQLPRGS